MSLPPGTRVGIYEIVELIGVGGMGEVYRARDSRLDRPVAIKTLPVEFAADPDRLARFEREAKTLAQLNHPYIASIYGLEPGTPVALAMEMAEGETLAQRIAAGPIALDDALIIARQIAEGLEHAHAKGIVHRDLKPANIKVGPRDSDPHVKILDFGLAKAMSTDASPSSAVSSPTITSPVNLTRAGVVLGTAAYMAPEQARGRFVDHRADIWAFGCVLFEMLTRRRAFEGEDVADVMAKVMQSEPDWSLLSAATPTNLIALLTRCLRKDQRQRFHSIADVRIELEEIANAAPADSASRAAPRTRSIGAAFVGLVTGAAITAGLLLSFLPRPGTATPQRPLRFSVACPPGYSWYRRFNDRLSIALSPDGEKLAAVMVSPTGDRSIFVRRLDELEFREMAGTEGATTVFWAADSTRLLFGTTTVLRQADLSGGGSRSMVNLAGFSAASWSADDQILAATFGGPLFQWPANGSQPVSAGPLTETVTARMLPQWLPNGEFAFLDAIGQRNWIVKRQKGTDQPREVLRLESTGSDSASFALQSGYLLVSSTEPNGRTVLTARPYDLDSGAVGDASVLATISTRRSPHRRTARWCLARIDPYASSCIGSTRMAIRPAKRCHPPSGRRTSTCHTTSGSSPCNKPAAS